MVNREVRLDGHRCSVTYLPSPEPNATLSSSTSIASSEDSFPNTQLRGHVNGHVEHTQDITGFLTTTSSFGYLNPSASSSTTLLNEAPPPPSIACDLPPHPRFSHRWTAHWRISGCDWTFLAFVMALQLAFGIWQCVEYSANARDQAALGWGVGLAKGCAGALYPTLFFMISSMSRWTATTARNFRFTSRLVNWDKFRSFHIRMAICALSFTCLHALGHLSGSFVHATDPQNRGAVVNLFGQRWDTASYGLFVRSLPGWTGLTCLAVFSTISLFSTPFVRTRCFEIFQICHVLVYPMISLLMAHGADHLLQYPTLGFVLALPTLLVLAERSCRTLQAFQNQYAEIHVMNETVVRLSIVRSTPPRRWWPYKVGQYVFVRIPDISRFEWHPFTISRHDHQQLQLYIKDSGNWTGRLRTLKGLQLVNVDGPFGAPCQRFYQYDHAIVVATGIGITPSSAILDELRRDSNHAWAWEKERPQRSAARLCIAHYERLPRYVDFYWAVPNRDMYGWFSQMFRDAAAADYNQLIQFRLKMYITKPTSEEDEDKAKAKLEGLHAPNLEAEMHLGRPEFEDLFSRHYQEMRNLANVFTAGRRRTIGVFFCGAAPVRKQLRSICYGNTLRGCVDGSGLEYHFHPETF